MNDDTNLKIKSIGLALVMVLSVVAIAAPASAQLSTSGDRTISTNPINADSSTTVTVTVTTDGSGNGFQIDDTFSGDIASASGSVVNDAGGSLTLETVDASGSVLTVSSPNPNSQFVYEYTITSVDNSTLGARTGSISISDGSTSDLSAGTDTINIDSTLSTGGPAYVLDGGPAPAGQSFSGYSSLSGSIAWQGQDITVSSGLPSGDIQLRERLDTENTRLAAEYSVDSTGSLTFGTADRTPGDYFLTTGSLSRNSNGIPTQDETFEISEQSLTSVFSADSVTLEGPNSDDEDFEFNSNRFEYPINVTTASGDLAAEDLADIFVAGSSSFTLDTSNVNEDDDTITLDDVQDADDYEVDFEEADIDAGDYEFVFSGADTTAEATDSITVTESNQDADFVQGVEQQASGDIAEFNLTLEDTNDAFVQIGGDDSNFVEVLYLEEDEPGEMNVQINTRLLGSSANSDAVYSNDNVGTLYSSIHPDPNSGDRLSDVLDSNDVGGLAQDGDSGVKLYEDDGQAVNNEFNDYVDNIGIAADGAEQLTRPPQPTDYQIAVGGTNNVDDAVFDADPGGEANNQLGSMTLELSQPEINGVTTHTAPEETADDEDEIPELLSLATAREEVAVEDRLIVQFEATGIYGGIVANGTNYNSDSDFDRLTDGVPTQVLENYLATSDEVTVEVVADEDIGNQDPLEVDLGASDSDTYLTLDQANDQFFLIVDTSSDDAFANGDAPSEDADFTATIEYNADEDDGRYEFNSPAASGDRALNAYPDPFSTSDSNFPYLSQGTVISESAELTLAPRSISFDNLNEDGALEAPASENAELSATTNVAPGSDTELRVTSTDASSSFRQGNDVNVTEDGSITTTYDLSGQEVGDAFDTNFRVEGSAVDSVDSVIVESVDDTGEEETNETQTDDGEDMDDGEDQPADDGETNETTDDGESTDDGTPGFGAVVALIALIGAALLAVRRQD